MTKKIEKVLSSTKSDVTTFIEQLQTLYAVDNKKIPLFEEDTFSKVETFDSLWEILNSHWSFFDYDLLKQVIKISNCKEALLIFQGFLSKIDPFLEDVELVPFFKLYEKKGNKGKNLLRIKVNAKRCNCFVKSEVKKLLSKEYKLEKYSLHFKEITKGCIEMNFKASESLLSHVQQHDIYGCDVQKYVNLKIQSIRIKDKEIKFLPVNVVSMYVHSYYIHICIMRFYAHFLFLIKYVTFQCLLTLTQWAFTRLLNIHSDILYRQHLFAHFYVYNN